MVIVLGVHATGDALELEDPDDFKRFHVRVEGEKEPARVAQAFQATGLGTFESAERAMVSLATLKKLAGGRVGPGWVDGLQGMLAYAARKGWYDEHTGTIQAHCELPPD